MSDEIKPRVDEERVMVCDRQCPSALESHVGVEGFMRVQCAIDGAVRFDQEGECTEHHRRLAAELEELKKWQSMICSHESVEVHAARAVVLRALAALARSGQEKLAQEAKKNIDMALMRQTNELAAELEEARRRIGVLEDA